MTTKVYNTLSKYANTTNSCSTVAYLWAQYKQADTGDIV